jgi:single-stranded DNA-binding protein
VVASMNRVALLGRVGKYGVVVKYTPSGTPCANFTLVVTEQGPDGKEYLTVIACEIWGRHAEAAAEIVADQLALFEGRLVKRKRGEGWELVVSGPELKPVGLPVPSLAGSN